MNSSSINKSTAVILVFLMSTLASTHSFATDSRCMPATPLEKKLHRDDFPWSQSLAQIIKLSSEIYDSGKRLLNRAYIQNGEIVLPVDQDKVKSWEFKFNEFYIKPFFIENLKEHFKKIKLSGYASELIYSDLGHLHIFAALEDIKKVKSQGLGSKDLEFYTYILHSKNTKFLYHTAEQLGAPKTKEEQWRKNHTTVIGDANGNIKGVDFTKSIDGYSQFFSIYFSRSRQGCFSTEDEDFDFSLTAPK